MRTVFDWVSVLLFIATAATFVYRNQHEQPDLLKYLAISNGCAIANELGGHGHALAALAVIGASLAALIWTGTRAYGAKQ